MRHGKVAGLSKPLKLRLNPTIEITVVDAVNISVRVRGVLTVFEVGNKGLKGGIQDTLTDVVRALCDTTAAVTTHVCNCDLHRPPTHSLPTKSWLDARRARCARSGGKLRSHSGSRHLPSPTMRQRHRHRRRCWSDLRRLTVTSVVVVLLLLAAAAGCCCCG